MSKKWDAAAQKYRPLDAARVAVVGEELGTQRQLPVSTIQSYPVLVDRIAFLEAELAQLTRYNADLYEMARARGSDVEQLRRDNELLVQLANDTAAAHVAELAKLMASAAQTVVAPVPPATPTKPEIPARALRFSA